MNTTHTSRAILQKALVSLVSIILLTGCSDDSGGDTIAGGSGVFTAPTPVPPLVVAVTPAELNLEVDRSGQFNGTVTGGAATVNRSVTWSTFATNIVNLDQSGGVTCRTAGTAQITATAVADANVTGRAAVTCTAPPPPARPLISISPEILAFIIVANCSQRAIGVINIKNISGRFITLKFASNLSAISPFVLDSSLQAGGEGNLTLQHDCSGSAVREAKVAITATDAQGATDTKTVLVNSQ